MLVVDWCWWSGAGGVVVLVDWCWCWAGGIFASSPRNAGGGLCWATWPMASADKMDDCLGACWHSILGDLTDAPAHACVVCWECWLWLWWAGGGAAVTVGGRLVVGDWWWWWSGGAGRLVVVLVSVLVGEWCWESCAVGRPVVVQTGAGGRLVVVDWCWWCFCLGLSWWSGILVLVVDWCWW